MLGSESLRAATAHAGWSRDARRRLIPLSSTGSIKRAIGQGTGQLPCRMDTIIAMSACPQDMVPINGTDLVRAELYFKRGMRGSVRSAWFLDAHLVPIPSWATLRWLETVLSITTVRFAPLKEIVADIQKACSGGHYRPRCERLPYFTAPIRL